MGMSMFIGHPSGQKSGKCYKNIEDSKTVLIETEKVLCFCGNWHVVPWPLALENFCTVQSSNFSFIPTICTKNQFYKFYPTKSDP